MSGLRLFRAACLVVVVIGCGGPAATPTPEPSVPASPTPAVTLAPTATAGSTEEPSTAPSPSATPGRSLTGKGVTVVIIDRGIDFTNPDFRNADGTTRIRAALDLSAQTNWCEIGRAAPVEYTEQQINDALTGGAGIPFRDAVGHGTSTAGLAAGNGSAIESGKYAGIAPEADLLIVKITSEGAPAHGSYPAEAPFNGCVTDALDWVDAKITELGQPAVALWNAGSQWGPIDGTSASSAVINRYFPPDSPGRIWVATSGDEGGLPNHAGADFVPDTAVEFPFTLTGDNSYPSAWFSGGPASVTITLSDGTVVGPFAERDTPDPVNGVSGYVYEPGAEFDPWTSTSGDHAVYMRILGHAGESGTIKFEASGAGHVDVYGDVLGPDPLTSSINFDEEQLVPGRVSDVASTVGVIVTGVHVALDSFVNMNGATQSFAAEGLTGELWYRSSGGPSRDGRDVVDVTAAGQNVPASLGAGSWWSDDAFRDLWPQDGEGKYIRFGGTSAAGPIVVGTLALMLEANPTLTTEQAREILHATASADSFTGPVPNSDWGYGKLDIDAAVAAVLGR